MSISTQKFTLEILRRLLAQPSTTPNTIHYTLALPNQFTFTNNMVFYKSTVLAFLAATVTAIDIRFYRSDGCGSAYGVCPNSLPNSCCTINSSDGNSAVSFNAIPSSWKITGVGYWQEGCQGDAAWSDNNYGKTDMCFTTARYRAASYYFPGGKRSTQQGPCQTPDLLVYEDGSEVDLSGLTEEQFNEVPPPSNKPINDSLVWTAFTAGGTSEEVQAHITALRL
ncbi:uncharacterized protein B0I36DRAFT_369094 [Microdochium trichocladiopsis]|uniref:Uncharacterized protein n=1 Tax=Microdochium trichocladiopsis TaxID=1682393 RepID=A0A9P8XUL3_9PEZI|nr:uncharacterized protein B0I36DRAFT_369094 [Microdochium trichocladiopsis]KAH7014097.1 hypothetical protein B0I36DRAFT_369094 [Microdochium trichocladiopsis]